ncbi:MAG TPA: thermonuclease family protein [Alphaproteobacteria bacterium]|nr:thermonuclease family protein [Alphaproteobacteria bacterium]
MAFLLLFALPALAEPEAPSGLVHEEGGLVVEIVDGDTVLLDDGREVRLVGLQAPKLPLGRPGFTEWPLAEAAWSALSGLVLERRIDLAYGGRRGDRHGRRLAHLIRDDGLWVQGAMLAAGMARVYSFPDNRPAVSEMLAIERASRAARRGIWADPFYAVRRPAETHGLVDTFQVVEGRVLDAAEVRGRIYLNFGQNWREDFTVTIAPGDRRTFEEAGLEPAGWTGRRIRVRGWIGEYNGPVIDATHPEQVELLEAE